MTLDIPENCSDFSNQVCLAYRDADPKRVYYMSMEFLMGRSLTNAVNNIGVIDEVLVNILCHDTVIEEPKKTICIWC